MHRSWNYASAAGQKQQKPNLMHNLRGYIYTVCTDWQWEDWEIHDDNMWSSRSDLDIYMSRSNILIKTKK